jgi:hypothetical protein
MVAEIVGCSVGPFQIRRGSPACAASRAPCARGKVLSPPLAKNSPRAGATGNVQTATGSPDNEGLYK